MKKPTPSFEPPIDLSPSLREVVTAAGVDGQHLTVALPGENSRERIKIEDRHLILLHDGKRLAEWRVPSLRELFRGDRTPPPDINHYPPEYCCFFYTIEKHVLMVCDVHGDLTDKELEEIFATLRRRPDGKSLGPVHDAVWQIAALTLGIYALSQAEFDAIFGQLARSTRHWQLGLVSRNYIAYVRNTLGRPGR
ncbi:MAG: hypothetical protein AAB466_01540 [Verrucomicrobiota bacterium]